MVPKVKAEWTESTDELFDLLAPRVDKNTCLGIMLALEKDANYKAMIQWLTKNPKANQCKIIRQLEIIRDDIVGPQMAKPVRSASVARKIASVVVF